MALQSQILPDGSPKSRQKVDSAAFWARRPHAATRARNRESGRELGTRTDDRVSSRPSVWVRPRRRSHTGRREQRASGYADATTQHADGSFGAGTRRFARRLGPITAMVLVVALSPFKRRCRAKRSGIIIRVSGVRVPPPASGSAVNRLSSGAARCVEVTRNDSACRRRDSAPVRARARPVLTIVSPGVSPMAGPDKGATPSSDASRLSNRTAERPPLSESFATGVWA